MKLLICLSLCLSCIAVTSGIYMSVESLGRRAIPALAALGARGGVSTINLLKGLKIRIGPHGPPVHVYQSEHKHHLTSHSAHVVSEPEPEVTHTHLHHGSHAVVHTEPHHEPIHEPIHHHLHHGYHHIPHHIGHLQHHHHLGHFGHLGHLPHAHIGIHGLHHGHPEGFGGLIGDNGPLGLGLGLDGGIGGLF